MSEKRWDSSAAVQLLRQRASLSNANLRQVHAVLLTSSLLADRFFPNKLLRSLLPGQPVSVLRCFPRLRRILPAFRPNKYTFSFLLTAASSCSSEDDARRLVCCLHGLAVVVGCDSGDSEGYVSNGLIHAYAGRGLLCSARRLFEESLCCGRTDVCSWTSLLTAYGKAGHLDQARDLFDGMPHRRNDVSWSAMLSAYVAAGGGEGFLRALQLFQEMQRSGVRPNRAAVVGALAACGALGALDQGSMVQVDGIACEFVAGDRSHPRMRDIISTLTNLHAHRDL
ncbi:hypothetical protein PR202_ga03397 [Eleusine coracana subsp. coracana]|uniref:Pentatricopeptide repeat-containing protein n=1 Tax=Eleusine coracana subsp. coracana TaxID=191504 RepID=A0AAV5BP58_ELECO|nr:hypothetical protein PR202_ga03397 [Eleusine coracana subsp. coracana]